MKLLSRYNRINIFTTIIILLLSSFVYYFFIRASLLHQLDKDLKIEEKELRENVQQSGTLPEPTDYKDEQEFFLPSIDSLIRSFKSIEIYNPQHHEEIYYRQLQFSLNVKGRFYNIIIRKSQEETEDLIKRILLITLGTVIALLVALFLINHFVFRKLWKPFTHTLDQLEQFDISKNEPIVLPNSDIDEFNKLNDTSIKMTNKAIQDYNEIRNFTENASHEIQTPLAIIKSRLELLSQMEALKEDQMENIQAIFEATNRLSKLNQSLLLLTKIDNRQFHQAQTDFAMVTRKVINNLEELIAAKNISISQEITALVSLPINDSLAEILISNLITNAIKHNIDNGNINISLDKEKLIISNTGKPLSTQPHLLFERFKKEKANSESLGLGLAIVKKIIENYGFSISYTCIGDIHTVTITFSQQFSLSSKLGSKFA